MLEILLFRLYGPLAAHGEIAVGERRPTADRPGRSAVVGLLEAALGIIRDDEAAHEAIERGYGIAVRTDAPGTLLRDFHTAQVPAARRGRRWATRRDELVEPELETILSQREYRADSLHTVAVWRRDGAPRPLHELAEALRRPAFRLCVGRRSCPLGLPPRPCLVEAPSLSEAFRLFDAAAPDIERQVAQALDHGRPGAVVHADIEARAWLGPGWREGRIERRRDVPLSRRRWQFGLRDVLVAVSEAA
jgi:CRISPR system Cascade subunit CasD